MTPFPRPLILLACVAALSGCGALSAVSDASAPLDAYTLAPLPGSGAARGSRHLVIDVPEAGGALATDRILVKPNRLQAQYLPKGRWVDPAPVLLQSLLVASLQSAGGFRLVGRDTAGLVPDYLLLSDLHDFQAEATVPGGPPAMVRIGVTLTMVRDADRSVIATRRFEQTAQAADDESMALVQAFDAAMVRLLSVAVPWVQGAAR
ncbi:ABC-type transport auxiliary lipoprotein family protein [Paracoccaceae bacterium Fryx2]|nr:ABC-type transport auxiliary lipoprotein family protein [Paracoccaceae bacterium Fryx2]